MSAIPNASPLEALPKRIQVEIQKLQQEPVPGVSCIPRANNSRHFDVLLQGPGDSPYEGGVFRLEIFLPAEYPLKPPRCRFLTRIYQCVSRLACCGWRGAQSCT
jgi:ubiquitin-conjugating enzyme E2 N